MIASEDSRPNSQGSIQQQQASDLTTQKHKETEQKCLCSHESLPKTSSKHGNSQQRTANMSKTMSPMNLNHHTSKRTIDLDSCESSPVENLMMRTLQSSKQTLESGKKSDTMDVKIEARATRNRYLPDGAITSIAFSSEIGSDIRGWDPVHQNGQNQHANITISSSIMDQQSAHETQWIDRETVNTFPLGVNSTFAPNASINTDRSPSLKKMQYSRRPGEFRHIHRNTQRQAIAARTIYFDSAQEQDNVQDLRAALRKTLPSDAFQPRGSSRLRASKYMSQVPSKAYMNDSIYAESVNITTNSGEGSAWPTMKETSGKKLSYERLTNEQQRQLKFQHKKSLMKLPKLPDQVRNQNHGQTEDNSGKSPRWQHA